LGLSLRSAPIGTRGYHFLLLSGFVIGVEMLVNKAFKNNGRPTGELMLIDAQRIQL
jgi:hypothetical protein